MAGGYLFKGADVTLGDVIEENFAAADAGPGDLMGFAGEADFHGEIGAAAHRFLEFAVEGAAFGLGEGVEPAVADGFRSAETGDLTESFVDVCAAAMSVGEEHADGSRISDGA